MYSLARNVLFRLSAETSHDLTLDMINAGHRFGLCKLMSAPVPNSPREVMGLMFNNPVGLAAGLDKNAACIDGLGQMGFGFIEVGTITPRPQQGNPKPRMFRLIERKGIINRMGFNNLGVDRLVNNIRKSKYRGIIGINIGKNIDTPVDDATEDYLTCLRKVYPYAGYVTINLSSPNTPGLRALQFGEPLNKLLGALKTEQAVLKKRYDRRVPLVVKIAPDMTDEEVVGIAKILQSHGIEGVVATNTTIERKAVQGLKYGDEEGGLSGAPLSERSTEVIKVLVGELKGKLPVIGVGGVDSAESAAEKIKAGASLIQIYSGFIYKGPALIRQVAEGIYSCEENNDLAYIRQ